MDDLIVEFLTETNEGLQELDVDLIKLEQNPNDKDLISKIFRLMHTIKGTCGFLGLPRLETVAHRAENVMGRFRDGNLEVTPDYVSLILESLDRVRFLLGHIEANGSEPEGEDSDLIEKLDAVYEGRDAHQSGGAVAAPAPAAEQATEEIAVEEIQVAPVEKAAEPAKETKKVETKAEVKEVKEAGESAIANQSLRVNVDVLENLMTMVSELVLTRNQLLQIARNDKESGFVTPLQRLNHVVSELQEGVMKTRMQPIGNAWAKLPRIIRDLSMELGKKIDLVMTGQDTELDRQVLDMIKDPLTHMVRNSGDHGIETPADRIKAGKPETGTIHLRAFHEGGHIIIEISDDGKGLPIGKIKAKIVANGLATEDEVAKMSAQQVQQYIFHAGFSTAEKVTSVSGRGVGMDVVRTNIEKIGGSIELNSVEGKGSTFSIKIPLTLAIVSSLIVAAGGERFAIPQLAVRELVLVSQNSENRIEMIKNTPVFRLREKLLPLVSLSTLLKLDETASKENEFEHKYIIVTQVGGYSFGLIVDQVYDTEEIVVKPVAKILKDLSLFSGNTILGDGSVIMILDPGGIAKVTGETQIADDKEKEASKAASVTSENKTSLLLFTAGDEAPKAVPLSLISRLENVEMESIERTNGQMLVQYRGTLMPIIPFNDSVKTAKEGQKPLLVFADRGKSVGILVDGIVDIREEVIDVQVSTNKPGLVGSAIISGKATEIVEVMHYLNSVHGDWFKDHGDEPYLNTKDTVKSDAKRRILLVDDSPFFRNMLCPVLTVAGYEVVAVDSPLKAFALSEHGEKFDLIISDIEMPEMNGFDFATKVRSSKEWQDIPMVAMTSHSTPEDIDHGYKSGFDRYIAKFDRETLIDTINRTLALGGHQA